MQVGPPVTLTVMSSAISVTGRLQSWVAFLRAHSAITRQMNSDLMNAHGLTLNDYEVLLLLSHADEHMMRRVDLAQSVVLTASGITRLLDGLERAGFVEKENCESDARVSYAKLTEEGHRAVPDAVLRRAVDAGVDTFVRAYAAPASGGA